MDKTRVLLIASIVANIFLLGAIGGGIFWLRQDDRMIFAGSLRIAGSELPSAERDAFRTVLREARRGSVDRIIEARAARVDAAQLLRQPVVDAAALAEVFEKARAADGAVRFSVEQSAIKFAATLSQDERELLADALEERGRKPVDAMR